MEIFKWMPGIQKGRTWATFGNPNFLASYLTFIIPIGLLFFIRSRSYMNVLNILFLGFIFTCLAITKTRASWLGSMVSVFVFVSVLFAVSRKYRKKIRGVLLIILVGVAISFVYKSNLGIEPIFRRFQSVGDFSDSGIVARFGNYLSALRMTKESPVVGVGPANYYLAFPEFESIHFLKASGIAITAGFAHNEVLQAFSTLGIPGGLIFLLIGIYLIVISIQYIFGAKSYNKKIIVLTLFSALLGSMVQDLLPERRSGN